jgi:hypothetical protein
MQPTTSRFSLALAVLIAPLGAFGQTVLSDFSDLDSQNPTFLESWNNAGTAQYSQQSGFITIEPVGGGNPQSDGYFVVGTSLDLTAHVSLEVTAREGAGNATGNFSVVFYNNDDFDTGPGALRVYTFAASDFAGVSFSTESVGLGSFNYEDINFNPSAVTFWSIEADPSLVTAQDFRFDFDNIQLTPVPEPTTWALLALGAGAFWANRARRKRN